jgi:hypothetical protein
MRRAKEMTEPGTEARGNPNILCGWIKCDETTAKIGGLIQNRLEQLRMMM